MQKTIHVAIGRYLNPRITSLLILFLVVAVASTAVISHAFGENYDDHWVGTWATSSTNQIFSHLASQTTALTIRLYARLCIRASLTTRYAFDSPPSEQVALSSGRRILLWLLEDRLSYEVQTELRPSAENSRSRFRLTPRSLARFERDVLSQSGLSQVIVLLGNADIGEGRAFFRSDLNAFFNECQIAESLIERTDYFPQADVSRLDS